MTIVSHPKFPELVGVRAVAPLTGFVVHVIFTDGSERDIDLDCYLQGPIFEPIRNDPQIFAQVFVDPIGQTLAWPNGADIDPDVLYYNGTPPWMETDEKEGSTPRRTPGRQVKSRARTC